MKYISKYMQLFLLHFFCSFICLFCSNRILLYLKKKKKNRGDGTEIFGSFWTVFVSDWRITVQDILNLFCCTSRILCPILCSLVIHGIFFSPFGHIFKSLSGHFCYIATGDPQVLILKPTTLILISLHFLLFAPYNQISQSIVPVVSWEY